MDHRKVRTKSIKILEQNIGVYIFDLRQSLLGKKNTKAKQIYTLYMCMLYINIYNGLYQD